MKPVVQIWLPALATLYSGLAMIWGFPNPEEIVGTIVAVNLFLGTVLGISSKNYKEHHDGKMVVNHDDPMKDNYTIELDIPLDEVDKASELKFKVLDESQKNHGL